ncbi:MAG: PilN domain-containing protein [Acidobacteria bacterium]|nr:PilN domain-containing protein [Acidobacteriota bacterium]
MIKINLLDSVTERQGAASVAVEKKVSSRASRLLLMSIAVLLLFGAVVGWDFISTTRAKAEAERQRDEQKKKAAELEKVMKEQKELEDKIKNVDLRIEAIKKLRSTQAGPSAVLISLRERIGMTPDIYLESVEQKGDQLTIKGSSPNETSVTQFGRSLEFSSGLFSNLSIETQRKEIASVRASTDGADVPGDEVIEFTIRCSYTPENAGKNEEGTTASNQAPGNGADPQTNASTPKVAQKNDN